MAVHDHGAPQQLNALLYKILPNSAHGRCLDLIISYEQYRFQLYSSGNYMFKVDNRNTRTRCEIYSKLTIKIPERLPGIFLVNFEHISQLPLVFLLLTLSR